MSVMRRKWALLFISAVVLLLTAWIFVLPLKTVPPPPRSRVHLSYSVTVQNPTNKVFRNAAIRIIGPMETTALQERVHLRSDHSFKSLQGDAPIGVSETLLFEWGIFPPYSTKIVTIRSDIDLWETPRKQRLEDVDRFLEPELFIESDDPRITALAAALKAGSALKTVQATFAWVSENLVYSGYLKRTRGALYGLEHRRGDCTEFAYLFVALCRANKIPARVVGGFVCPHSAVLDLGDYHNWAEFYHDGRWHVADPQHKRLMREQDTYIAFHYPRPSEAEPEIPFVSIVDGQGLVLRPNRQ